MPIIKSKIRLLDIHIFISFVFYSLCIMQIVFEKILFFQYITINLNMTITNLVYFIGGSVLCYLTLSDY